MKKHFKRAFIACMGIVVGATNTSPALALEKASSSMSLWELLVAGGWVMIPLAGLSVLALGLAIYQWRYASLSRLLPQDQTDYLLLLLEKGEFDKAKSTAQSQNHIAARITTAGLNKISKGSWAVEEAIAYEGRSVLDKSWATLNYLGDIAVLAPMLGLLGTVLGMIQAFDYQAFKAGNIQPISLAQGLSKAMITTAFGLIVAVPVLACYGYFRKVLNEAASKSERIASEINQYLSAKR